MALRVGVIGAGARTETHRISYHARVERINPTLNAIVTLDLKRARTAADRADAVLAGGESVGSCTGCRSPSRTH